MPIMDIADKNKILTTQGKRDIQRKVKKMEERKKQLMISYFLHEEAMSRLERINQRLFVVCWIMAITLVLINVGFLLHCLHWI